MSGLITNSPELFSELTLEIRLFTDDRHIEELSEVSLSGLTLTHFSDESDGFYSRAALFFEGEEKCVKEVRLNTRYSGELEFKKYKKRAAKQSVYDCLREYFGKDMPWGSLTGIRPTKLFRQTAAELGVEGAEKKFSEEFFVSPEKLALSKEIFEVQRGIIASASTDMIDVYVGIPFCTSRCAYCSFSSGLTSKSGDAEKKYVDALISEIELMKPVFDRFPVRSVYIGGGTPTSLDCAEFGRMIGAVAPIAKNAVEFTVEAGRPDTITPEKLELIKRAGASRISVNAQTTRDETLERIGRAHSSEDFFKAFELAKGFDFDAVNTDLIAGLPGERIDDVKKSVSDVISLGAENVTVHTLAIKHGSKFAEDNARAFADSAEAERMISEARALTAKAGYRPYYLYRQKYMAGNLENVGYSLPGKECVYNIDIMEETMSIIALGAGGISKRFFADEDRIERAANVKDIKNYVERTGEMAERKAKLFLER